MTKEEYLSAMDEVIYLSGCVINEEIPDKDRIEKTSIEHLYNAAQNHMMTAIVGYALESAGIKNHEFNQALAKSIRKVTMMDIDRAAIFAEMEKEGIWYMPLKGAVIKELYPSVGLRELSDNDILFDADQAEELKSIMTKLGFSCKSFGKGNHDVYFKQPVSNFEMHSSLFLDLHKKELSDYYQSIKKHLINDTGSNYGYHFSNEDLYVYIIAHEYKHYHRGGTGLRSVLDTYVLWKKLGNEFDVYYIESETKKLGISEFEKQNRSLALHLFGGQNLTEENRKMLEVIIFSGTYGTMQNLLSKRIDSLGGGKKGKTRFIIKTLFIPMKDVKAYYPLYYKYKILIPFLPFHRLIRALTVSRSKAKKTFRILRKIK